MEIITIRFKSRDWLGRIIRTELREGLESKRLGSREGRISLGLGDGLEKIWFESRNGLRRRRLVSRD